MTNRSEVKPGQFVVLLKQCAYPECEEWFIGSPSARYCVPHKKVRSAQLVKRWKQKHRTNPSGIGGKRSLFSREEIEEMRDLYLKMPVPEIAAHFNCDPKLIYRYQKKDPVRYRV